MLTAKLTTCHTCTYNFAYNDNNGRIAKNVWSKRSGACVCLFACDRLEKHDSDVYRIRISTYFNSNAISFRIQPKLKRISRLCQCQRHPRMRCRCRRNSNLKLSLKNLNGRKIHHEWFFDKITFAYCRLSTFFLSFFLSFFRSSFPFYWRQTEQG